MVRRRRPIVSTLGLTRSNGSVSHAGNSSTSSPRYCARSPARCSASDVVGRATMRGRRSLARARPATAIARAASVTARWPPARPPTPTIAGSSAATSARARNGARSDPERGVIDTSTLRSVAAVAALVEALHGALDPRGGDELDRVGRLLDHDVELGALRLRRPLEHVVGAPRRVGRLADADAHAQELVGLQARLQRPQPVVAGEPAARLQLELAHRQVELVVHDDDLLRSLDAVPLR